MRRFLRPANVVLVVLLVVTATLLVLAIQKQNAPPPGGSLAAAATPTPSRSVAFIGDGYTSGSPDGGLGPANYTALLANRNGWTVTNQAVYGSGYVAGIPLDGQLDAAAAANPQLVVVTGGRADVDADPPAVRAAADRLYPLIRSRIPEAKVVVIGPMWIGGQAPQPMLDVRDAVRDAAADANLPFVDPIADGWFNGRDQDGIVPGGANLNDRGHQRLADLVNEAVQRSGVAPR